MRVRCPSCSKGFQVSEDAALGKVRCPACGQKLDLGRMARPGDLERGSRLGGCRIDGLLGRGGMAVVYKATQLSLDRPVALKVLPKHFASNRQFVDRFSREASALARLAHPNIVGILDKGVEGETYYFVMEYVEGRSLRELLQREGRLPPERTGELMQGICAALEYAHESGIVHRDLKPSNVLLDAAGMPKLADFGIARIVGGQTTLSRELTVAHSAMGSADYMAPEQRADAASVDHRADIYALGVVLYQMLTGHIPAGSYTPASKLVPEVPASVDRVIRTALAASPDARFESVALVRAALARALQTIHTHTTGDHRGRPVTSRAAVVALVLSIVAAGGLFAALLIARSRRPKAQQPTPKTNTVSSPEPKTEKPPKKRPEKPPKKQPPRPNGESKAVKEALEPVRSFIAQHPNDYQGQISRFEAVIVKFHSNPAIVAVAGREREAAIAQLHKETGESLKQLGDQADAFVEKGDYGAALRIFELFPEHLRTEDALARLKTVTDGIHARAADAFAKLKARADALVKAGKPAEAVALLQPVRDWRISAITKEADTILAGLADVVAAVDLAIAKKQYEARVALAEKMKSHWSERQYADALALVAPVLDQAPNAASRLALKPYQRAGNLLAQFWIAARKGARAREGKTIRINGTAWTIVALKDDSLVLATGGGATQGRIGRPLRSLGSTELAGLALAGLDPKSPDAHLTLGLFYTHDKKPNPAAAKAAFEKATSLKARPADVRALRNLGVEKPPVAPKPTPKPTPGPAPIAGYALVFNGTSDYVEVADKRHLHLTKGFTAEAWVWRQPGGTAIQYVVAKNLGWDRSESFGIAVRNGNWVYSTGFGDEQDIRDSGQPAPIGKWVHVALVCAGTERALFINGKLADKSRCRRAPTFDDKPLTIGAEYENNTLSFFWNGAIDEVRISRAPRYRKDFAPERTLEADRQTAALLNFDEGEGRGARDAGRYKGHGRILGARHVRPDTLKLPPPPKPPAPKTKPAAP